MKNDRLADHEQDRDSSVGITMSNLELMQPFTQKMQDQKEIADHENGINDQLDQKCAQRFDGFLFHPFQSLRVGTVSRSCLIMAKSKFRCTAGLFSVPFSSASSGQNMADPANRYPENVPGKFYVDDQCIDCDLCRETAPANFKRNDDGGHSYVYKQAENPEEEARCKEAMEGCPVEAIGNDG